MRLKKLNRLQEKSYRPAGIALDAVVCRMWQGIAEARQHEKNARSCCPMKDDAEPSDLFAGGMD